jgi:hypothetical protein
VSRAASAKSRRGRKKANARAPQSPRRAPSAGRHSSRAPRSTHPPPAHKRTLPPAQRRTLPPAQRRTLPPAQRRTGPPAQSRSLPPAPRKPSRGALRREIRDLARSFADDLVLLLERHGIWSELEAVEPDDAAARRIRRSPDALRGLGDRILDDLRARKGPAAISAIAGAVGATAREIAHPIHLLVEQGLVQRSGERRGARYEIERSRRAAPRKGGRPAARTKR